MENNIYYNYIYLDPRIKGPFTYISEHGNYMFEYEPFYVGKGQGDRYKDKNRSKLCMEVITDIEEAGLNVVYEFPHVHLSEETCLSYEEKIIETIGRLNVATGPLVNKLKKEVLVVTEVVGVKGTGLISLHGGGIRKCPQCSE